MSRYLRNDKRRELREQRKQRDSGQPRPGECPYCRSKSIVKGTVDDHCRNCYRHFTG